MKEKNQEIDWDYLYEIDRDDRIIEKFEKLFKKESWRNK